MFMQRTPGPNTQIQGPISVVECPLSLFHSFLYLKGALALQTLKLPLTEPCQSSQAKLTCTLSPQGEVTDGCVHHHGHT